MTDEEAVELEAATRDGDHHQGNGASPLAAVEETKSDEQRRRNQRSWRPNDEPRERVLLCRGAVVCGLFESLVTRVDRQFSQISDIYNGA